ncbi:MAG: hypothetical protein KBD65_03185 [Candidatus Moranbacteria bacterium]|nr:hypothetical protein [Candidatus Moranbacteria bacterium]
MSSRKRSEPQPEDFDWVGWEQEARRRAAWGQYAVHVSHQNFHRDVAAHDRAVKQASTAADKKKAIDAKEKFLQNRSRTNALYIG